MIWLATQMWVELLLAAGLGVAGGWWLHLYLSHRHGVATAPAQAATATQTTVSTAAVAPSPPAPLPATVVDLPPDDVAMIARRRLEARVRFLESQLASAGEGGQVVAKQSAAEDLLDPAHRLRWRATYLAGRVKYLEEQMANGVALAAPAAQSPAPRAGDWNASPIKALDGPRDGKADDLKQISGIGPKLEKSLNKLGVYHFDQIADWTQREIDWANQTMSFRGRIEREKWVNQATELARLARAASPANSERVEPDAP